MACDFQLPLFAAPCSEVLSTQTSMVDGKMAEKAVKARRTARASACMIRKGFLFHFPSGNFNVAGVWKENGPHPWSDASVMMAADAFSVDLMVRRRLSSLMCRNPSPKAIAAGGRFAGDVSCTIPRSSADNCRRTALMKKWQPHNCVPKMSAAYKKRDAMTSISVMVKELSACMAHTDRQNLSLRDTVWSE
ncbi:hypothetical protein TcCL_ESM08579 [Trypanosoma cruzi]|nr:hypothetical protein TcCL_ESM08579 [Trypanosoma cruzi]